MATILRDGDLSLLSGKVAVVGYGAQGHAHALNLRDSGVEVAVGLRPGGASWPKRRRPGSGRHRRDAVRGAQLVAMLIPDQVQPRVFASRSRRTSSRAQPSSSPTASTSSTSGSRPRRRTT